ncbi:MAG: DoxX family protein [Opitutaceae bacterium]|nr:DoxX family protein [Opitutaceae bacterium]
MASARFQSEDPAGAVSWSSLLLRSVGGLLIVSVHGCHKAAGGWTLLRRDTPWPLVEEVAAMHLPAPLVFAWVATLIQVVCGALIVVGWRTRLNACLLAATMGVAIVQNLTTGSSPELAMLYAAILATVAMIGGGRYSIDARIALRKTAAFSGFEEPT